MERLMEELQTKMGKYSGDILGICYDALTLMNKAETDEKLSLFIYFCKNLKKVESDETLKVKEVITQEDKDNLQEKYGELIDSLLETALNEALENSWEEEIFYDYIWRNIVNNSIFSEDIQKSFALYYLIIDRRIPFYKISSGLSMENDLYKAIINEKEDLIEKMEFVLAYNFKQKTMEASNLIDILLSEETYEGQVVLLSLVLSEFRNRERTLLKKLQQKEDK